VTEGLRQRHLPPTRTSPQGGAAKEAAAAAAAVRMEPLQLLVESRPSAWPTTGREYYGQRVDHAPTARLTVSHTCNAQGMFDMECHGMFLARI
jgi:hypothetical protein